MQNIHHIFFDLDHTLWNFEKNSNLAFQTIFNKHKLPLDFNLFFASYTHINLNYWKLYRNEKVTKKALRYGRLKDTFDAIKFKVSDELVNQLSIDYITELPNNNYLFDGAVEVLEYLKPKYNLHIITNGFNEVQFKKLQQSKIDHYFEQIITSEAIGVKKPNPKIFQYALQQTNAKAENSIMIGDNWEADILGAINNGIKAIYFNKENKVRQNGVIGINHLLQLKNYL